MEHVQSLAGYCVLLFLAWIWSENRRRFDLRMVIAGTLLQFVLALLLLHAPLIKDGLLQLNALAMAIERATRAGTTFVFGYIGGGPLPFQEPWPGAAYALAFRGLPIILVMSALSALLFHWGILQRVVQAFSWLLRRSLGIGGALGVGAAANIFMGMIEAPLLVRPYLAAMTRSELFALMTTGMATVAGTMLVLYAGILEPVLPGALGHILTASIISAPAAILVARLMVPETGERTDGALVVPQQAAGAMDAVTKGTLQGVQLYIPVLALLVVLVALVSLCNQGLGLLPEPGGAPLTLQRILGLVMAPLVWLLGVPWGEAHTAGALMGTKVVLNEFIAYLDLAALPPDALSERSRLILTYAMCGFANLGSLGILIGGLGSMVPERRDEIVALGLRSIYSGVLATSMTGAVVGLIS